jgi:hypothetical protein
VPANTPIELQILDRHGMALRTCHWIWAKNHEPRGCIGCHEDPERTPENLFKDALERTSIPLCLPAHRRRTVDFRRDVMPIVNTKCISCHNQGGSPPRLDESLSSDDNGRARYNRAYRSLLSARVSDDGMFVYRYVHPGKARTSPLIWHIFGRNTSRPWDKSAANGQVKPIPSGESEPLNESEKRTFVEWIDLGALWDGVPGTGGPSASGDKHAGE